MSEFSWTEIYERNKPYLNQYGDEPNAALGAIRNLPEFERSGLVALLKSALDNMDMEKINLFAWLYDPPLGGASDWR